MNGTIEILGQEIVLKTPSNNAIEAVVFVDVNKYKFSRAKWYVAEFDDKYYFEVDKWCEEQFGPHPKQPDAWSRWIHRYTNKIHFAYEKDYVLFCLRWQ